MTDEADPAGADRTEFRTDPVEHVGVRAGMTVGELAAEYAHGGFGAGAIARAVDVYAEMLGRDDVTNFFGLAGALVPAGMRAIVADLVRDGHVDVLVTTGATLTHDTIEALGGAHHHGRAEGDSPAPHAHDERLRAEGVDRIYDVYLPQEHFVAVERHLRERVFPGLERTVSIRELTAALGEANAAANEAAEADAGIAAAAFEADVPVYCPAIQDSVLGLQAWMYSQVSDLRLDALADMTGLNDIAHDADRTGAMVVGGGVPKNFVLQTMLVTPGSYDYAVQLTVDPEHAGGLSGASLDEARSWGKLEPDAENVTVVGDATITLPLVVAAARERLA